MHFMNHDLFMRINRIQCCKSFGLTQYFVELKKRINPAIVHQVTVILTEHYTLFLCVNGVLKEIG